MTEYALVQMMLQTGAYLRPLRSPACSTGTLQQLHRYARQVPRGALSADTPLTGVRDLEATAYRDLWSGNLSYGKDCGSPKNTHICRV